MKVRLFALLVALALVPLFGSAVSAAEVPPPGLVWVTWDLVTMQAPGQPAEDTTGAGLTIAFTGDGRVSGSAGCNQFTGTYRVEAEGQLAFSPLAATLRACTETKVSERETRYFATLREVAGFVLVGTTGLRLTFEHQGMQLVYQRGAALATAQVTGTALYLPRILPPPTSVVTVQLLDTSRQDVPAVVLAEQQIQTKGGGPPYAFTLVYDPARIVATGTYAVQARLEDKGQLLFRSTRAYLVITQGRPTSGVEVVMDLTGTPQLPTTGGGGMAGAGPAPSPALALALGGLLLAVGGWQRKRWRTRS